MGVLSRYLESEGLATAGISLVREHTAAIRPPRALWVPFDLGRPLGVPHDAAFQEDVLLALLRLFERSEGPVLEDYPREAPPAPVDEGWSCALPVPAEAPATTPVERRQQALRAEVAALAPWFAEAARGRGRTAWGLTGLQPDTAPALAGFIAAYADGGDPPLPDGLDDSFPVAVRHIADDLKALYLEAAAAQPGAEPPGPSRLARWLYHETELGRALYDTRDRLIAAAKADAEQTGTRTIVPPLIPAQFRDRPPS